MIEIAAITASVLLAALTVFQCALILGAPIGRYAWGGTHDVLPTKLRIGSAFSILLYILFAVIILSKARIMNTPAPTSLIGAGMWVLTGYFFLGIVMNGISRSKSERLLMTPIVTMLSLLFLYVAIQ